MISSLVRALISAFKARRELALENVALRQQLAVLRRSVKRPRLSNVDRVFWVLLRRIWTDWESVLVIAKVAGSSPISCKLEFMEGTGHFGADRAVFPARLCQNSALLK